MSVALVDAKMEGRGVKLTFRRGVYEYSTVVTMQPKRMVAADDGGYFEVPAETDASFLVVNAAYLAKFGNRVYGAPIFSEEEEPIVNKAVEMLVHS